MQTTVLHSRGLYTYPNQLGELPIGALFTADNVVIDRDGTISPRRGFATYGNSFGSDASTAKQLMYYKGRVLRHWGSSLDFDSDGQGTFVNLSNTVTEQSTGVKIKFQEMNGNLYFTSNQGIQRISAANAADVTSAGIFPAGSPAAVDGVAYLNSTQGWFTQDSVVAYRVLWGITDENKNLIEGSPSQRILITNSQLSLLLNDYNKLLQALDIAASVPAVILSGSIGSGPTTTITVTNTSNLSVGMNVSDTGSFVPSNTIINEIVNITTLIISKETTNSSPVVSDSFTFSQNLSDTDYSTLSLTSSNSSIDLYNGLIALSKKLDADLLEKIYAGIDGAITNIVPTYTIATTGNTNGTTTISNLPSTQGLRIGLFVTGSGVPTGTTISSIPVPPSPVSFTGNTTINSSTISSVSSEVGLSVGMTITGPGVPANTTIQDIIDSTDIALSNPISATSTGVTFTATNITVVISNTITSSIENTPLTFSYPTTITSPSHGLQTGDDITIVGSNSVPVIDTTTPVVVTVIDSNTFTIPTITTQAGSAGTWTQYPPAIAQNFTTVPSNPATTAQLITVQQFYDDIVNELNVDENIAAVARRAIGGDFSNSTQNATTNLIFTIPSGVSTAYFYQIYRSDMATSTAQGLLSDQTPDDECKLIVEGNPTSQDITNGYINFFDNVPESFRLSGANLYTNAISGAGILQENSLPPYAQDMCLWMNFMFYANTSLQHQLQINLLTAQNLIGHTFTTTYNSIVTNYNFVSETNQITSVVLPAGNTFASSGTADSFDIYNAQNYSIYRFYFNIGSVTPPSSTGVNLIPVNILTTDTNVQVASKLQYAFSNAIQDFSTSLSSNTLTVDNLNSGFTHSPVNNVTASGFSITVTTPGSGEQASTQSVGVPNSPTPAQQIDAAARSLVRIINKNPSGGIGAQYLSGPTNLPGQILLYALATNLTPFYLTSSSAIGSSFDPTLPSSGTSVVSDNQAHPNYLYFSKIQEPDAVPQVNFQAIGQEDYPILRIMPLRDSLFILKADGVYRLYGTDPSNFTVYLFDSSTKLLAQDTAAVLNNQVYMLSNQGVVTVSDTGVSVISRPIEGNIIPVTTFPNYTSISFSVPYEADRSYHLWIQNSSTDTEATVCYRYNTFTNTWVSWPITKTCGVVVPDTNIMYLGPNDTDFIEQERKSYTRLDQADRQYTQQIPTDAVSGPVLSLGSVFEAEPGDVIVQTQYLTVDQYNRFINKLDTDPGLQNNYSSQLANTGDNLRGHLTNLATELDTDSGLTFKDYSSSISSYGTTFQDTQQAFNVLVGLINSDPGARLHNYSSSNYTTGWESVVVSIDTVHQKITVADSLPWIAGPMIIYKAIESSIEWSPQHCGDPSMLKKIYEGTFMFENMAFDSAFVSYSSDLYTGQFDIPFNGDGCDIWGGVDFGQGTWGGNGTSRPLRTYIPVPVQRCRFIQAFFDHDTALRTYAIFGISYTWEGVSSRAYR